jgi:hypothetical protein
MFGMTVGGWLGWWLGSFVGLGTAALLSGVGGGAGLWAIRKVAERYLD